MNFISIDAVIPALVTVASVAAVVLVGANGISSTIVRFRARRLPAELGARLSEEWSAEVQLIEQRTAKLAFAFGLLMASNRSFELPATWQSLAFEGKDDIRIYSDYGARIVAVLIDTVVDVAVTVFIVFAGRRVLSAAGANGFGPGSLSGVLLSFGCAMGAYILCYVYCVLRFGASPGKLVMGLRTVTVDGSQLTARHAVARISPWLFYQAVSIVLTVAVVLFVAPDPARARTTLQGVAVTDSAVIYWMSRVFANLVSVFCIADLSAFWSTEHRRSLRDIIAGTVVILKVPDTIEVPSQAPPVKSTSMFR